MKKLVFLHGGGADKNAYFETMQNIALKFNAELITFNAPFPHPNKNGKFIWFNKKEINGRRDAVEEDYFYSLGYIKNQLSKLKNDDDDIILIGHSQGGGLAVHVGLEMELGMVISICGDLPYNISYKNDSTTPIYWCEGGKDTYIDDNRKKTHYFLKDIKANYFYQNFSNSTHNEFTEDLLNLIENIETSSETVS